MAKNKQAKSDKFFIPYLLSLIQIRPNGKSRLVIFCERICLRLFNTRYGQTVSYFPTSHLKLCLVVMIAIILMMAYWIVVREAYLTYTATRSHYAQNQTDIVQLQRRLNNLADLQSLEQQFQLFHQQITVDIQTKWQANLMLALNESGTQLIDWQPTTIEDKLKISGSFEQLTRFLLFVVEALPNKRISEMIVEVKLPQNNQQIDHDDQEIPLQLLLTLNEVI